MSAELRRDLKCIECLLDGTMVIRDDLSFLSFQWIFLVFGTVFFNDDLEFLCTDDDDGDTI